MKRGASKRERKTDNAGMGDKGEIQLHKIAIG